jgi:hypothetical protein
MALEQVFLVGGRQLFVGVIDLARLLRARHFVVLDKLDALLQLGGRAFGKHGEVKDFRSGDTHEVERIVEDQRKTKSSSQCAG